MRRASKGHGYETSLPVFFEDASMPPMSVQRLGEAITHLAARTRNRGGRRSDYDVPSLAPLLRTEAVLSRILLVAGLAARTPKPWRTTRRL